MTRSRNSMPLFDVHKTLLVAKRTAASLGAGRFRTVWNPSPSQTHRLTPYPVPKTLSMGTRGNAESGAKMTPPPFAVGIQAQHGNFLLCVSADSGWHRWNSVRFQVNATTVTLTIDLEERSDPHDVRDHVRLSVHPWNPEQPYAGLAAALRETYPESGCSRRVPDWWQRPIYCGWGDQVAMSAWAEGPGPEARALAYCTQGLYERWLARLEAMRVPVGTVIVDAGWSAGGVWKPLPHPWPDMRGFIDRQHARGRKVLLWIPTWLCDGLPDRWCIMAGKRRLCADPGNPEYRRFLIDQTRYAVGRHGLNADGFKIDQLAYVPNTRSPRGGEMFGRTEYLKRAFPVRSMSPTWGVELLLTLQQTIADAARNVKPDALINTSTAHPAFVQCVDMLRLHDTGDIPESANLRVLDAMAARAALCRAALPNALIDTDNWVHSDYREWRHYTLNSWKLGVPCLFYAARFVRAWREEPCTRSIAAADLRRIGDAWRRQGF